VEEKKREGRGAARGKLVAAKPEPSEGGAGTARNTFVLCVLFLLCAAPPYHSATSTSAASLFVTAPPPFTDASTLRPVAT
jgi:hypothetical protein